MLSRVADAILWMSRYIERAEHAARVVDVNMNLVLDFGAHQQGKASQFWEPLIGIQEKALFHSLYDEANERTVPEFITFRTENPNSVISSVGCARENARTIRESISSEMWESLNKTYWSVHGSSIRRRWDESPHAFYQDVKEASQAFQGITDATMLRGEEWQFVQLGKYLERADATSRLLDIKFNMLLGESAEWGANSESAQWTAVLKSCSAYEAYRRSTVAPIEPWRVAEFLIFSAVFPRSIHFSVASATSALAEIGKDAANPEARNADRLLGQLRSHLDYGSVTDVQSLGMHAFLDDLQVRLNQVAKALYSAYLIFEPVFSQGLQSAAQQQEQQ